MASAKQIAANRRNAKASTGPRSALGKARASRNARRHGLAAETLTAEEAQLAARLIASLRAELPPSLDPAVLAPFAGLTVRRRAAQAAAWANCASVADPPAGAARRPTPDQAACPDQAAPRDPAIGPRQAPTSRPAALPDRLVQRYATALRRRRDAAMRQLLAEARAIAPTAAARRAATFSQSPPDPAGTEPDAAPGPAWPRRRRTP